MGIEEDLDKALKKTYGDYLHATTKAGIALTPILGGGMSELFSLVSPPLEKRKNEWLKKIAQELDDLKYKIDDFNVEKLFENEIFISNFLRASQLAITIHQKERLKALKNTVINSALEINIDENEQMLFINLIESMTDWHIKTICYFEDPMIQFKKKGIEPKEYVMGSPMDTFLTYYPELSNKEESVNFIITNLYNMGILTTNNLNTSMSKKGVYEPRLTKFGQNFLDFIREPLNE